LSERNVDNYNVLEGERARAWFISPPPLILILTVSPPAPPIVILGFKNAITQTSWFTPTLLASSSADRGVHLHDANTGSRIRKYTSHNSVVNCVVGDGGSNLVVSGGDDRFVMLHDVRSRDCVARIKHGYQVLAVDIDESRMWTGGVDNVIRGFEIRALTSGSGVDHKPVITLGGHNDSVTGLKVGLGGTRLVSNGMDGCVKSWDISPYVTSENSRLRWSNGTEVKHDSEKRLLRCTMSEDGGLVTGGSSDRNVHVMDGDTGEGKFLLPGHEGAVTDVQFNGGVIGSAGVDRNVLVGVL